MSIVTAVKVFKKQYKDIYNIRKRKLNRKKSLNYKINNKPEMKYHVDS